MPSSDTPRPAHLLLVEDNPDDVDLTLAALEDSRLRVTIDVATDGEDAMALLRREGRFRDARRPDLILLDLNLPRKNGREVLEEIKGDPELAAIPVVVLTTSSLEADIRGAYARHANCYITKPVVFDKFMEMIRTIEGFWLELVKLPKKESGS